MIFLGQKEKKKKKKKKKKTHLLGHLCFLCIDAQGIYMGGGNFEYKSEV